MHKIKPSYSTDEKIVNKFETSYNSLEDPYHAAVVVLSDEEVKEKTDKLRGLRVNLLLIPKAYSNEEDFPEIYSYLKTGLTQNGIIAYY